MFEHDAGPGEYRPYGADTVWCPVCDRPLDRTRRPSGRCPEHERDQLRYSVSFTNDRHGQGLAGFLDMMRYDGGTVRSWDHDRDERFTVRLSGYRLTTDRWATFGLYPKMER